MKRNTTKKALLMSALSLLLCMSMLVGTTFAWFTDSASTGVNSITSGTLNVGLQMLVDGQWVDAEGQTLAFVDDEGNALDEILWEPGCSYLLQPFKIVNEGNLALKFDIVISGMSGDVKLAEAIEWGLMLGPVDNLDFVAMGDLNDFDSLFDGIKDTVLLPGEEMDTSNDGVTLHMREDAGNEFQGLTLSGISITVLATQATVEEDSYDDQYDKDATYPYVSVNGVDYLTIEEAIAAAKPGQTVTLKGDIITKKQIVIDKDLTLDLGGYTIFGTPEVGGNAVLRICSPNKDTDINVTINATLGGIKSTGNNIMPVYAGHVELGKTNVTINGGDFESAWKWAIYQNNGTCTINGGSFRADGQSDTANGQPVYNSSVLDSFDSTPELTGKFVINGGKFYGFNPACLSVNKGEHHNHDAIAAGKTGILDEDGWFVVADGTLTYHIVCDCDHPASAHEHCYASLADAEAALANNNCPNDKIVEGVGAFRG